MSEIELMTVKPHQHSNNPDDGGTLHPINTLINTLNVQACIILMSLLMS